MKIKRLAPTPRRAWQEFLAERAGYPRELVGVVSRQATSEMIEKTQFLRSEAGSKDEYVELGFNPDELKPGTVTEKDVAVALRDPKWRRRLFLLGPSADRERRPVRASKTFEPEAPSDVAAKKRSTLRDAVFKGLSAEAAPGQETPQ